MAETILGILGGSGVYEIDGLEHTRWEKIQTPWGDPSDALFFGELAGQRMVFLPRHGRGHRRSPTTVNYRANIDAMKRAGVTDLIALSACGSLREDLPPGTFVIIDQLVDRTFDREKSFFSTGMVAHVSFAEPVCARLGDALERAAKAIGVPHHRRGTYITMEGPQFSTLAESKLYRSWGMDVIGMTNAPEAKLAREAEMCFATVAMVTDFDCWHPDHAAVDVSSVIKVLLENAGHARELVRTVAPQLKTRPAPCPHGCDRALDHALITAPEARDPKMLEKLDAICRRVLGK